MKIPLNEISTPGLLRLMRDLRRQLRQVQAITVVAKEKRQLELLECD